MTLHVPRLSSSLDPLIAEAKRRARERRLIAMLATLVVVAAATALALDSSGGGSSPGGPSARLGSKAPAGQPASAAEFRELTPYLDFPSVRGGLVAAAWVSSADHDIGLVLLYPGHWLSTARPGSYPMHWGEVTTISPKLVPEAAKPDWAYLIRLPGRRANAELLAQTVLRGPNVLKSELTNFCAVGNRIADALTGPTCHRAQ